MTYGRQQKVNEKINWVTDEDGNVIGSLSSDGRSVIPLVPSSVSTLSQRLGSRLQAGKPWLRRPSSIAGMLATSANATIALVTRRGRPAIEVTIKAAAGTSAQGIHIPIATPAAITAFQHAVIEVEDASRFNGGTLRLGFFDGSLGTITGNGMQAVYSIGSASGWNGIHVLAPLTTPNYISASGGSTSDTASVSEWAAVNAGAFNSTVMTQIAVRASCGVAGNDTRFWIYEIAEGEKSSLPSINFVLDDGHKSAYNSMLPILEKYGFPATLAFIADERGTSTRMSKAEWADAIINRGHSAVVHGCRQIDGKTVNSLRDYFTNTYGYATAFDAMCADIVWNRDVMVSEGLDPDGLGRTVYVLPQGFHQASGAAGDETVLRALQATGMVGCRLARVEGGVIANGGWSGASMYLPIIGHNYAGANEASNISALIATMQAEIGAGRPVVIMGHEINAAPTSQAQITSANFEAIVAAAAALVRAGQGRPGRFAELIYELRTYQSPVHLSV